MTKKYTGVITSKHVDWGGDASTGGLKVAGNRVQEFIKSQLDGRVGLLYYDQTNNRYLAFADAENRDLYLSDSVTYATLLLGAFDAPFNFTAKINLTSKTYVAILSGTTGNYIDYTFDVLNKSGQSTGEAVTVTYKFVRNGKKQSVTVKYQSGTVVHFNIDKYLSAGQNNVTVELVGANSLAATTVGITYQVIDLKLSDTTDQSKVYNLGTTPAAAEIPYTVSGTGTKTMEWYLDGQKLEEVKVEDEITETSAGRTKYISLANLSQGTHSIQFRAYVTINGENFYSDTIYRDVIVYTGADSNTIISVGATIPTGNNPIATDAELQLYGITQYIPYAISFYVYNPTGAASTDAVIAIDGITQTTISTTNSKVNIYELRSVVYGQKTMTITAGPTVKTAKLNISKSTTSVDEINDGLMLSLSAIGRTNNDKDKESWIYGAYSTTFTGLQWNDRSGWNAGKLILQAGSKMVNTVTPFTTDFASIGGTLEFEFSTANVTSDDEVVCDLRGKNGAGLLITASEASLTSTAGSKVSVKFKSEENVRISFVINKKSGVSNKCLMLLYVNGVLSGAQNYAATDNFSNSKTLTIGNTTYCDISIRSLRFYKAALTSEQILNNYILYRPTTDEMLTIYDDNDIYDTGSENFSVDKLAAKLPVMIITGEIPVLEETTDKNKTIYVDIEYINMHDTSRSFKSKGTRMKPQGTSSMSYPKKNFRIYLKYGTLYDADGNVVSNGLYQFSAGAQPVSTFCMKADYAESSSTHNTGIARLWNNAMTGAQLSGEYICRTEAQKSAIAAGYAYDVRTTVDGFPICMFYRLTADSDLVYMGKYNFNNDKSTESVFGFKNVPGFDNSKMQCWEVLNNGHHLCNFLDVLNFDSEWSDAFEARYPDGSSEIIDLKDVCTWISSTRHTSDTTYSGNIAIAGEVKSDTDKQYGSTNLYLANGSYADSAENRQAKFAREKWDYLDVHKMAAYYVYFMRFGAVDQVVKNCMFTTEGLKSIGTHCKWFYINYDNDTINGLVNDGPNVVPWTADRQSLDARFSSTTYYYAGHESTLWNNLEADTEFMRIVSDIDNALYQSGLSYQKVIDMFDNKQMGAWCERIYNQDAQYKYIGPYVNSGINNLFMCQGSRQSHRRWWLSHRFNLMDSLFVSGGYKGNCFEMKVANAPSGIAFTIKAGAVLYYGWGVNNVVQQSGVKLNEGQSTTFTSTAVLNVGDPVRIYGAVNLEEIDIHNFMQYLAQITMTNVYDEAVGTKLKKLIIGVDTSTVSTVNTSLSEISGLSAAKRLEYLDIGGMQGITTLDLSKNTYLSTLKAFGSGLTSLILAPGGAVSVLELPASLIALSLDGLHSLVAGLSIKNYGKNIATLFISNCPSFDSETFVINWLNNKTNANNLCNVSLYGVNWESLDADTLIKLGKIRTDGGTLNMTGKVIVPSITLAQITSLEAEFGEKCFSSTNELYIQIPNDIYLIGNTTVNDGESQQYKAVVVGYSGDVSFCLLNGPTETQSYNSCTIDATSGLFTTSLTGAGRSVTLRVKVGSNHKDFSITVQKLVYPSSASVSGKNTIMAAGNYQYDLALSPSGINAAYDVVWSITGTAVDNGTVSISSYDKTKAIVTAIAPTAESSFVLTATITYNGGSIVGRISVDVWIDKVIISSTTNAPVLAVCYAAGWCAISTQMTLSEAIAVTNLNLKFNENSDITSFDELKYFAGLNSFNEREFQDCSNMASITIPTTIKIIPQYCFFGCNKISTFILHDGITDIKYYAFAVCYRIKTIISKSIKAPNAEGDAFNYCGNWNSKGTNILYVPSNSTGYDKNYWLSQLCSDPDNFTLSKTL